MPLLRIALLLTLVSSSPLAAAGEPFAVADLFRVRTVREARLSPDGREVAYALQVPRQPLAQDDGAAWVELHLVDASGTARPLVAGEVQVAQLAWSPDGGEILFVQKRSGDEAKAIYALPRAGGEARRRVAFATDVEGFALSPDGRTLAFLAKQKRDAGREELAKKGFSQEVFEEEWQPTRVWIAPYDASAEPRALDLAGSASDLSWAPSGDRLLVALAPTPSVDDGLVHRRLHVVEAAGGQVLARLAHEGKLGESAWSPDGRSVALVTAADRKDTQAGRLWLADAAGGGSRDLLPGYLGHVEQLAWESGTSLLFVGDRGVESEVARIDVESGRSEVVVAAGAGVWNELEASGSRLRLLVGEGPALPAELFLHAGEAAPRRLTTHNSWLAERALAEQTVFRYRARDGLELEGLLLLPRQRQPGERLPLALIAHGGPEAHYSQGWLTRYSEPGQVLAGRGYAVFYPNYRGSTGRGVAFAKSSQGDPAGKEFDDLLDGVDALVAAGLVDGKRVGVTGGSYGGYATAWLATAHSPRIAAGVMFVGISEIATKAGTTDIPIEDLEVHFLDRPWQRFDLARRRSPLTFAERSRTPLLILHGKDDPRVHPSQSLALYRYLKLLGQAPVRYVAYPGEGHGNRRAASQLDYALRLLQWFDHYLRGPGGAPPPPTLDYEAALAAAAKPAGG